MTNGEKFKEVFKISRVYEGDYYAFVWWLNHKGAEISIGWWNAEYKGPAKAEPRKGQWILDESDNSVECSLCGCKIWANDIMDGEAHFCPNCGADMKEAQNEQ